MDFSAERKKKCMKQEIIPNWKRNVDRSSWKKVISKSIFCHWAWNWVWEINKKLRRNLEEREISRWGKKREFSIRQRTDGANNQRGNSSVWTSFLWLLLQQFYTCMVCTINSAGQARTRHDTSLGYLHLLAKEVDTNAQTEKTKTNEKDNKKRKCTRHCTDKKHSSQGLDLGWQH